MLLSMGWQSVGHDLATEQQCQTGCNCTEDLIVALENLIQNEYECCRLDFFFFGISGVLLTCLTYQIFLDVSYFDTIWNLLRNIMFSYSEIQAKLAL